MIHVISCNWLIQADKTVEPASQYQRKANRTSTSGSGLQIV